MAVELGVSWVAGVDEAGRGALAGPVFAAAVMLPFADDLLLRRLGEVRVQSCFPPCASASMG